MSNDKEQDVSIHVLCERCGLDLATALTKIADLDQKNHRYNFELRVIPCGRCEADAVEQAESDLDSIRLVINESEKESVLIV